MHWQKGNREVRKMNLDPIIAANNFEEAVFANFRTFQIAIPCCTAFERRRIFSSSILVPKRTYSTIGWLLFDRAIVALLTHISIQAIASPDLPFKPILHLGSGVPVDFEARSETQLPSEVSSRARLSCQMERSPAPVCTIFRHLRPRFVRVYPFRGMDEIVKTNQNMLAEEDLFLNQNFSQLQHSAFYREQFCL